MDKYDDIINLEHYEPKRHPRMSKSNRASQFAPFKALTGYNDEISEVVRLTTRKIEIDENLKSLLDRKIKIIISKIKLEPEVTITYFLRDLKKDGGRYVTVTNKIRKIDTVRKEIILIDRTIINFDDILSITSDNLEM